MHVARGGILIPPRVHGSDCSSTFKVFWTKVRPRCFLVQARFAWNLLDNAGSTRRDLTSSSYITGSGAKITKARWTGES